MNKGWHEVKKADIGEIIRSLRLILAPGQVTELRALEAVTKDYARPHTVSGYFDYDHIEDMARAAAGIIYAKGIYFMPNPVNPALLARCSNRIKSAEKGSATSDVEIVARYYLPIDCDAQRPAGISTTDAEHEAAKTKGREIYQFLKTLGWPDPIAADSGNGWHLLYHIDLPAVDDGLVQRCLESLAARFDDDLVKIDRTVFNPARIWKLYGTVAAKGDATPDRPHRLSQIVSAPGTIEVVTKEMMETLAVMVNKAPAAAASGEERRGNDHGFDLEAWIRGHGLAVEGPEPWTDNNGGSGKRWVFSVCPWNQQHTNESAFIVQRANGAISAGCRHNGCKGKDWYALRDVVEPGWRDRQAKQHVTVPKTPASVVTIQEYKPFPVDALPEPVRSFVKQAAVAMCCDESFIALPLLAAAAAAVGNCFRIELKTGWTEPCILWCVVVADSGTVKSPALELALRPVRNRQFRALKDHQNAKEKYEADLMQYDLDLTAWKRSKGTTDSPVKPEPPVCWRNITEDITVEALALLLVTNWRGLLVGRDEWAGWLRSFGQYKQGRGGDEAHWLNMHGGRQLIVDRKTTGTTFVRRAAVSICGGIQPGPLARALQPEFHENGLLARVLFAYPPKKRKRWSETGIDPAMEQSIADLFDKLYSLEPRIDDNGDRQPEILHLSPEAKQRWITFFDAHADEQVHLSGDEAAAWSKLEGYAARLAMVIHCLRWAAGDSTLAHSGVVDDKSMEAGIALSRWFGQETCRVYAILDETDVDRDHRELVELIQRHGGRMTAHELARYSRAHRPAEVAENALNGLVKAGLGRWEETNPTEHGGRPTSHFVLFQGVAVAETSKNGEK